MTDEDRRVGWASMDDLQQENQQLKAATTTAEQDRKTAGQRRINAVWEITQAVIALAVTFATLYVSANLALKDQGQTAAFLLLSNAFFLVIGFYFGRTNHQRSGGVGGDMAGTR